MAVDITGEMERRLRTNRTWTSSTPTKSGQAAPVDAPEPKPNEPPPALISLKPALPAGRVGKQQLIKLWRRLTGSLKPLRLKEDK